MPVRTTVILTGSLLASLGAQADNSQADNSSSASKPVVPITFESVDSNTDQRISRTEAGPHKRLIDRFAYIDTDGDGFISKEELYTSLTASTIR